MIKIIFQGIKNHGIGSSVQLILGFLLGKDVKKERDEKADVH